MYPRLVNIGRRQVLHCTCRVCIQRRFVCDFAMHSHCRPVRQRVEKTDQPSSTLEHMPWLVSSSAPKLDIINSHLSQSLNWITGTACLNHLKSPLTTLTVRPSLLLPAYFPLARRRLSAKCMRRGRSHEAEPKP